MPTSVKSINIPTVNNTVTVAMSTSSATTTAPVPGDFVVIYVDATCFCVQGASPTATAAGKPLIAGNEYRVYQASPGVSKFAFIMASGTGNAYITPGA